MAVSNHEDQQQIENFKYFWQKGGKFLFGLAVVMAVAYLGYGIYQNHQNGRALEASNALHALSVATDKQTEQLAQLQNQYPNSMAAVQGSLLVGAQLFNQGKLDEALSVYQWVLEHQKSALIHTLTVQSLANVYVQKKQFDRALQVLDISVDDEFKPLLEESKGDVYSAQNKNQEALSAYQQALDKLPQDSPNRNLLMMKLAQVK